MVRIEYINFKKDYKELWLMGINNVNLNNHCKRCFKGYTDKLIKPHMKEISGIELPECKYYYLCGVCSSW